MSNLKGERRFAVSVTVDYSESLRQMIAAGSYDEQHPDINPRNFRVQRTGCLGLTLTLVQFDQALAPLEVVIAMKRQGYRSAIIEELLALGREHPDLQRIAPIIGLGSARVVQNRRYVPCLGGSASMRTLTLVVIYRRWSRYYRFAFVQGQR